MHTMAPTTEFSLTIPRARTPEGGTAGTPRRKKNRIMEKWRRTHTWMPTPAQDRASAPEWATIEGAQKFREGGHGKICSEISARTRGPVLVQRATRTAPRHPVYVIAYATWQEICAAYPDLRPSSEQIGSVYPASIYREHLATDVFDQAFRRGTHSFAQSWNRHDPWYVAFVPRMWMQEAYARLERDGLLHLVH